MRAERRFRVVRAELEDRFRDLAGRDGRPAGLRWVGCEFRGDPVFAVTPDGRLDAALAVTVRFEPVPGGEMEGVPAATLPRSAAAVFHHRPGPRWNPLSAGVWGTGGRVLFNHDPAAAAERVAAGV